MPVEVEVTTEYYFEESELDPNSSDPLGRLLSRTRQDFERGATP